MGTEIVIAASGTVVLAGLASVARAVLRVRDQLHDNTAATRELTRQMGELTAANGRLARTERMIARIWSAVFPGELPPG